MNEYGCFGMDNSNFKYVRFFKNIYRFDTVTVKPLVFLLKLDTYNLGEGL